MIKLIYALAEFVAASVAISLTALLVLEDWRKNPQYVLAGWLMGPLAGFIVLRFEFHPGLALAAATIAAITAPWTVAALSGKSANEVVEDLLDLKNKISARRKDSE